jgi:hypothetical protein
MFYRPVCATGQRLFAPLHGKAELRDPEVRVTDVVKRGQSWARVNPCKGALFKGSLIPLMDAVDVARIGYQGLKARPPG